MPSDYLTTAVSGGAGGAEAPTRRFEPAAERQNGDGAATQRPNVEAIARVERTFLAMCLAERGHGREYLERLEDDHFSSEAVRRVRDHLVGHYEDPLAELPADDPSLVALVTDVAMRSQEERASAEALRLTFLQLELQRVQRQLRHAERDGDFEAQRALWPARESVRVQIDELMGQTQ